MPNRNKKDRRLTKPEKTRPTVPEYGVAAAVFRAGPLPQPEELQKYKSLYPGVTKLLFDNYVAQTSHRMELENTVIHADNKRANTGQTMAFILGLLGIISGSILTYLGKNIGGLSLIFGSIGTILTAFYGGVILRHIERTNKDKAQIK